MRCCEEKEMKNIGQSLVLHILGTTAWLIPFKLDSYINETVGNVIHDFDKGQCNYVGMKVAKMDSSK